MVDNRIESTVLVIGRAAKLNTGGARGHDLLFERLHQARFANAWFATEEHHLPDPLFRLRPALLQQYEFFLATHQWRQALLRRCLKAALRRTLSHYAIE